MHSKRCGRPGRGWNIAFAGAAFSLATALEPAHATHVGDNVSADQALVGAGDQLLAGLSQWERLPVSARPPRLAALVQLARHRQEHLLALLQKSPQQVLSRMIPRSLRDRLPAQAAAYVEQEAALQGTLRADIADDFAKGTARTTYRFVAVGAGAPLELHLADGTASERDLLKWTNRKLAMTVVRIGDHLVLGDKKRVQLLAEGAATSTATSGASATASAVTVQGVQNTLVIMANFSDAAIGCTPADLQARLFGAGGSTLNQGYVESSGGLVSFSGKVIGPFNIPFSSAGSCDPNGWSSALDSAARAAGVEPATYTRVSYTTPKNPSCGWNGLATLGGTQPTPSWIQTCAATGVFSHELGHNLGFNHAGTATSEYADYSDPMGTGQLVQSNAPNRVMAGWIAAGQLTDVVAGGSYALSAIEVGGATSPRVLRLPKRDTSEVYYVSLRQPTGIDANLMLGYQNALSIHHASGALPAKTVIDAVLTPGQSWTDSINGISIVNQGIAGSGATVGVTLGAASCARAAPLVSVTPASQTGVSGTTFNYTVNVTNQSSAACPASTFSLTQTQPAGFTGSFTAPSLVAAPGATVSSNWTVSSSAVASDATYTLTTVATDSGAGASTSAVASAIVYTPATCTRSTPLVSVSPASQSGGPGASLPYTVTVTNRNSAGCGTTTFNLGQVLPGGFAGALGTPSVGIAAGASVSSSWTISAGGSVGAGTYTLTASAVDSVAGGSAQGQANGVIVASDTIPPTLNITTPTSGSLLSGRSIGFAATASDASGVKSVAFYVDTTLMATLTTAPYSVNLNTRKLAAGAYTLRARATDGAGNVTEQSVAVTIK